MKKLPKAMVREIKRLYAERAGSQAVIAARFGVSQAAISAIVKGHIHRDVPWPDGTVGSYQDSDQARHKTKEPMV